VPLLGTSHSNTICSCPWVRSAPAAQHLHTPLAFAHHCAHARATRSAPPTFLLLQHLHRLSSIRAPASPKPCRFRSRACLTPVPAHACSRVSRAHSEPQTHAYTGPVLLLHLCASRCTGPPAPRFTCTSLPRRRLAQCPRAPSPRRVCLLPARTPHTILQRLPPPVPFHICALPAPRRRSPSFYRGRLFCLRRHSPASVPGRLLPRAPLPRALARRLLLPEPLAA
jgi:hypothetical protein